MSIAELFCCFEQIKAIKSAPERRLMINIYLVDKDDPPNSLPHKRREAVAYLIRKCQEAGNNYTETVEQVADFFCLEQRAVKRIIARCRCFG